MKVIVPDLGEGIEKATISFWYFKEGDTVQEKDDLVELATDKATFNLPSPCSGTVTELMFQEGETVHVGDVLAVIEEEA